MSNYFQSRKLAIATKHHKEKVIAPLLSEALQVECRVNKDFDTDILGTFTGEKARTDDPVTAARKKCMAVMDQMDCDLAIASEGSFGPHPSLIFIPADDEIVILVDRKNQIEIIAREISTSTNFNAKSVETWEELKTFAEQIGFPSHALIIRKDEKDVENIRKGINDWNRLKETFDLFTNQYGRMHVETDMRAMYNPTRMKVIEKATHNLLEKIKSTCPSCQTPGFAVTSAKEGLPCSLCNQPTRSVISHIYTCQKCSYVEEKMYPYNKLTEDPMYCDYCNP